MPFIAGNFIQAVQRFISGKYFLGIVSLVFFIVANAIKISIFDHLIIDSSVFPSVEALLSGGGIKVFLVTIISLLLIKTRLRLVFVLFYALQCCYILLNLMYYFSFQGYLHISQYISLISEAFDLVSHAALPWDARSLFVLADLPPFLCVLFFYKPLSELDSKYLFKPVLYATSILFIWFFYKWEVPAESPRQVMDNAYSSDVSVVSRYGLIAFNFVDLVNYTNAKSQIGRLDYGPPKKAAHSDSLHPDILVIQVESLDARIVDYKYRNQYVMPYLHALSQACIYYPYVLSYHLAGSTSDCEFSTINSVEPFDDYPSIKIRNYGYPNSYLKQLDECGYETFAFHGNRGTYFNRNAALKKMGFTKFYDLFGMGVPEIGWGASDESVFEFVKNRMASQKPPFLYYVITMSTHEPFVNVRHYFNDRRYASIADVPMRNYLNSMSYFDRVLEKFMADVRRLSPGVVIIMYGDHTPTLPKCGYEKAAIRADKKVFEYVPLFIITPAGTIYREGTYSGTFLDVAPTILSISRCSGEIRSHGQDLLSFPIAEKYVPYRADLYSRAGLFKQAAGRK
jgi:lipoteichoic acid synthase